MYMLRAGNSWISLHLLLDPATIPLRHIALVALIGLAPVRVTIAACVTNVLMKTDAEEAVEVAKEKREATATSLASDLTETEIETVNHETENTTDTAIETVRRIEKMIVTENANEREIGVAVILTARETEIQLWMMTVATAGESEERNLMILIPEIMMIVIRDAVTISLRDLYHHHPPLVYRRHPLFHPPEMMDVVHALESRRGGFRAVPVTLVMSSRMV